MEISMWRMANGDKRITTDGFIFCFVICLSELWIIINWKHNTNFDFYFGSLFVTSRTWFWHVRVKCHFLFTQTSQHQQQHFLQCWSYLENKSSTTTKHNEFRRWIQEWKIFLPNYSMIQFDSISKQLVESLPFKLI
mgnify:CR=1 FL=1